MEDSVIENLRSISKQVSETGKAQSIPLELLLNYHNPHIEYEHNSVPRKAKVLSHYPVHDEFIEDEMLPAITPNQADEMVKTTIERIDKKGIPNCLKDPIHRDAYARIVFWTYTNSKLSKNKLLYRALRAKIYDINSWGAYENQEIFWSRIMKLLNRSLLESSIIIGKFLGLKPEYCLKQIPATNLTQLKCCSEASLYVPDALEAKGMTFKLVNHDDQKAVNGYILYSI